MTAPHADAEARARIRTSLGESLFVEAAAGTGKTTELTERIVAVLAAGLAAVDGIVAVTFTEKAAGELKLRLRARLETARQEAPPGDAARAHLDDALARLEEARIGTIHGFCADLLRERPVEANVDPEFRTLTEPEATRLHDEAFDAWFESRLEDPPEGLRRYLRRPAGPRDDGDGVARLRRAAWELAEWRDLACPWRLPEDFRRAAGIDGLTVELLALARLAELCEKPHGNRLFEDTGMLRRAAQEIATAERARPRDHDGLEAQLVWLAGKSRDWMEHKGSGKAWAMGVSREDVLDARDAFHQRITEFQVLADADLAARLQRELAEPIARYQDAKERAGALDFVDLLLRARDLVKGNARVRAELQRRCQRIFVDEFQDTDPLQAELLLLLAADDPDATDYRMATPAPGKLFLVGDPKQSIYRFRRADVRTYDAVKRALTKGGVGCVELTRSFRAVPAIQNAVNAAFSPLMGTGGEAGDSYVPLAPARPDEPDQPAVVVLAVPRPYGTSKVAAKAIDRSLPHAVGAFLDWLLNRSGWRVTERDRPTVRVPVQARHVVVLFRRFETYGRDMTRPYIDALERRDIRHLLVGGKAYHGREEVATLVTALSAIEWPEDELSVYAALHGPLFAIGDEALLAYKTRHGRLHPFRPPAPDELPEAQRPIAEALAVLRELSRGRNRRPIAETIARLLGAVRAHAALVLRTNGEQVLANVLHLAELAREYEAQGGLSFRGFVDRLAEAKEAGESPEAPILEETSDGVRLMTVHRAKGLEFPVVVLADITAKLAQDRVSRHVDGAAGLCALRVAGCAPLDLREHEDEERRLDAAEGVRVAYVAATRARDLLVVPAVGDGPYEKGWVSPLNDAIHPPPGQRPDANPAPGCPPFGDDSVLYRPDPDPSGPFCARPGLHGFGGPEAPYGVVWWDPQALALEVPPRPPLRYRELLSDDVPPEVLAAHEEEREAWKRAREAALASGARPSHVVRTVTARAKASPHTADVETFDVPREDARPSGPRFGTLVHAVLSTLPLGGTYASDGAPAASAADLARYFGRVLGATDEEVAAAARAASAALAHPILVRARDAAARGGCRREVPVTLVEEDGTLVEGVIDLAFEEDGAWTVVDFKTDRELAGAVETYRRQVALYARAVAGATGAPVRAALLRV